MQGILHRGSTRILTLAIVVALAFAAGSAYVADGNDPGDTYYGCLTPSGSLSRIAVNPTEPPDCAGNQTLISWNQQGPQGQIGPQGEQGPPGPAGEFTGTLTSPDGRYSISVTDAGIALTGPNADVELTDTGVTVDGRLVTLNGQITTRINGSTVTLNCGSGGGQGVARANDTILLPDADAVTGFILFGSSTVQAC